MIQESSCKDHRSDIFINVDVPDTILNSLQLPRDNDVFQLKHTDSLTESESLPLPSIEPANCSLGCSSLPLEFPFRWVFGKYYFKPNSPLPSVF